MGRDSKTKRNKPEVGLCFPSGAKDGGRREGREGKGMEEELRGDAKKRAVGVGRGCSVGRAGSVVGCEEAAAPGVPCPRAHASSPCEC